MSSLTPAGRNAEAVNAAMNDGFVAGGLTMIPSCAAVYAALKTSPSFVTRTNWQSRTALAIMPPLFMFAFTAENKLADKMHEIATESRHSGATVKWAEEQVVLKRNESKRVGTPYNETKHLTELYQKSVKESGVCIVPGDELKFHHRAMNYAADNPIKVLAGIAVPAVATIFYGQTTQEHVQFSVKLLHTRVFGQFATISLLLSVMGFKEYMDQNGRFITQTEADRRVEEMHRVRSELLNRLEYQNALNDARKAELQHAHEEDVEAGVSSTAGEKRKKKKKSHEE